MSGIEAAEGVLEDFGTFQNKSKSKSKGNERAWIVYKIVGDKTPSIVKFDEAPLKDKNGTKFSRDKLWDDFCEVLGEDGAYGVFIMDYERRDGCATDGLVFVKYLARDKVNVRTKLLYGATMQSFKASLDACFVKTIEASTRDELDLEDLLVKLKNRN